MRYVQVGAYCPTRELPCMLERSMDAAKPVCSVFEWLYAAMSTASIRPVISRKAVAPTYSCFLQALNKQLHVGGAS